MNVHELPHNDRANEVWSQKQLQNEGWKRIVEQYKNSIPLNAADRVRFNVFIEKTTQKEGLVDGDDLPALIDGYMENFFGSELKKMQKHHLDERKKMQQSHSQEYATTREHAIQEIINHYGLDQAAQAFYRLGQRRKRLTKHEIEKHLAWLHNGVSVAKNKDNKKEDAKLHTEIRKQIIDSMNYIWDDCDIFTIDVERYFRNGEHPVNEGGLDQLLKKYSVFEVAQAVGELGVKKLAELKKTNVSTVRLEDGLEMLTIIPETVAGHWGSLSKTHRTEGSDRIKGAILNVTDLSHMSFAEVKNAVKSLHSIRATSESETPNQFAA